MKKLYIYPILIITLLACEDFLDEEPRSFISPGNFYQSDEDVIAATNGIYDVLTGRDMYGHQGIFIYGDVATDIAGSSPQAAFFQQGFDNYTVAPDDATLAGFYTDSYVLINRANTVINAVEGNTAVSQTIQERSMGEASFLRALTYFNLVRVFGDVVLTTTETSSLEGLDLARTSEAEVYAQIVTDLQQAENLLTSSLQDGGRATRWAAKALLAKVHLTLGEYAEAASKANEVMNAGFTLNPDFADVFLDVPLNPEIEHIFQVQFSFPGETNQFPPFFISRDLSPVSGYGGDVFGVYIATDELVNSYTDNDLRKDFTVWTDGTRVGASDIVLQEPGINKLISYAIQDSTQPVAQSGINSFPVLRYSDVLLMFAEATNQASGPSQTAYDAINAVRNRAGLADLTQGLSQADFQDAILEERKLELACEGHRWFDLKRTGRLAQELSTFGFQANNEVFPIPQNIIDANDQITQNQGY